MPKVSDKQFLIAMIIGMIALHLPTLWNTGGYCDEDIYMAIARAMHHGATLYVNIWAHSIPTTLLII